MQLGKWKWPCDISSDSTHVNLECTGPRAEVLSEIFWKEPSETRQSFRRSGGWLDLSVQPKWVIFHYPGQPWEKSPVEVYCFLCFALKMGIFHVHLVYAQMLQGIPVKKILPDQPEIAVIHGDANGYTWDISYL